MGQPHPQDSQRHIGHHGVGSRHPWKKAAGEAADRGYSWLAMENERLAFYVNEGGNIGVYDKAGRVWFTRHSQEAVVPEGCSVHRHQHILCRPQASFQHQHLVPWPIATEETAS